MPCLACNAEEEASVRKQVRAERRRRERRETAADARRLYRVLRAHGRKFRPLLLHLLGVAASDLELRRFLLAIEQRLDAAKALGRILAASKGKRGNCG
jgi:hypothetical protein